MPGFRPHASRPKRAAIGSSSHALAPGHPHGHGGQFAPGGGRVPGHSIVGPGPRSHRDQARDRFSQAKLDHKIARAAHRESGSKATASALDVARTDLHAARESYRVASGGKIEPRPLDAHDPRIRDIRSRRPGAAFGREGNPHIPARERREDRVLMRIASPVKVEHHHYGEPAPRIARQDAEAVKSAARRYEAGKPLRPDEVGHAARYVDRKASEAATADKPAHVVHDRITGSVDVHHDVDFRYQPGRHESFRNGRLEVLKAYGKDGREVPVDKAALDHLRGGEHATRESNVARIKGAFSPDRRRELEALPADHPRRINAGFLPGHDNGH